MGKVLISPKHLTDTFDIRTSALRVQNTHTHTHTHTDAPTQLHTHTHASTHTHAPTLTHTTFNKSHTVLYLCWNSQCAYGGCTFCRHGLRQDTAMFINISHWFHTACQKFHTLSSIRLLIWVHVNSPHTPSVFPHSIRLPTLHPCIVLRTSQLPHFTRPLFWVHANSLTLLPSSQTPPVSHSGCMLTLQHSTRLAFRVHVNSLTIHPSPDLNACQPSHTPSVFPNSTRLPFWVHVNPPTSHPPPV